MYQHQKTKQDLKEEIILLDRKNEALSEWLYNNTKHPDFNRIASDRNNNNFRKKQLQDQLKNWNLPPPSRLPEHVLQPQNSHKKYT